MSARHYTNAGSPSDQTNHTNDEEKISPLHHAHTRQESRTAVFIILPKLKTENKTYHTQKLHRNR